MKWTSFLQRFVMTRLNNTIGKRLDNAINEQLDQTFAKIIDVTPQDDDLISALRNMGFPKEKALLMAAQAERECKGRPIEEKVLYCLQSGKRP